jgi:hypothetical protein
VLVLAAAVPARAAAQATATCTTSAVTLSCSSWFTSDVVVHWSVPDCPDRPITADTPGETVSCTSTDGTSGQVVIKRDATPPAVGLGQPSRGADDNGWYRAPVTVAFSGMDALSGMPAAGDCASVTYAGPDTAAGSVVGACTDVAGNLGSSLPFGLKYDATGPEVTAAVPDRPPDYRGWYTAPVTFAFMGTDATSGLAACAPATYAGPDSATAAIVGTCADIAGNSSSRTFGLRFDATPPPVTGLRAVAGDRRVEIRWSTDPDATLVEVLRIPGVGANAASVVFQGPGSGFLDDNVENGVTYVYRVRLRDAAGNESTAAISATPRLPSADPPPGSGPLVPGPHPRGARLRFPRANAVIRASRPPILRWTRVRRARYYNVQLHRGGRKILSAWPGRPRYRLQRRWSYGGRLRRLTRGRYVWYVWPGYGRRSAARYGDLIGRRAFRIGQAR